MRKQRRRNVMVAILRDEIETVRKLLCSGIKVNCDRNHTPAVLDVTSRLYKPQNATKHC